MNIKVIQITAGRGPVECCWVVAKVLKYFMEALKASKIECQLLHRVKGAENGTLQSVTIQLKGRNLEVFLDDWLGTIQWIGKSSFRKYHKRKNWFIGMYEVETKEQLSLKEADIKFQAIRSSGPGGQHANKVSSAIRATHIKTGLQVLVMDTRSQHQNKKIAIKRLQECIAVHNIAELKAEVQGQWENHLHLKRGHPVRIFEGSDFRVKRKVKNYKDTRQQLKKKLKDQLE